MGSHNVDAVEDAVLRSTAIEDRMADMDVVWKKVSQICDRRMPALWLVRFEDGGHGLRRKMGARYTWLKGSKEDVLASVPDIDFERAVKTALAREATARSPS
jgi:hypothetical protein